MAIEYTKDGKIDITNREVVFKNGKPTNPEYWDQFKNLPEIAQRGRNPILISGHSVDKCFNEVKDLWSGMVLHTSRDRFEIFCRENNLHVYGYDHEKDTYTLGYYNFKA